jgi:carbamoylphosphate synthase small subunit
LAKFHIKLKVQGFELEVDGVRDDLPVLRQAITEQIAGLIAPATDLAGGEVSDHHALSGATAAAAAATEKSKRSRRKSRVASAAATADTKDKALDDWHHDSSKYGSPSQTWKNSQKAIWLMYVAAKQATVQEMSNGTIVATFSKYFRQAGAIRASNLARDLGLLKSAQNGTPASVQEDVTKSPAVWYLTDAGVAQGEQLVAQALGQTPQA